MSKVLHMQQTFAEPVSKVFVALTDNSALTEWFAEGANVSLDEKQYDFWGRFTPETPSEEQGHHDIQLVERERRLRYSWLLRGVNTTVDIRLTERDGQTILGLWHRDIPSISHGQPDCYSMGDIWSLWLDGLKRYVAGRPVTRCDFSADKRGSLRETIEIDGPVSDVWGALTDPEQLNRWIACSASAAPAVGGKWMEWGDAGHLEVLRLDTGKEMELGWTIDGEPTVVTWTLEESGGKTRLTLSHSGFAPDRHSDAEWGGWLNYLALIKSLVEFGMDWLPPVQELTRNLALYYAAVVWAQQKDLLEDADDEWS